MGIPTATKRDVQILSDLNTTQQFIFNSTDNADLSNTVLVDCSALADSKTNAIRVEYIKIVGSPGIAATVAIDPSGDNTHVITLPLGAMEVEMDFRDKSIGGPMGTGDLVATSRSGASGDEIMIFAECNVS